MKLGMLFAKDKKQRICICASSIPQLLTEIPTTNGKKPSAAVQWLDGYKCLEFGGRHD